MKLTHEVIVQENVKGMGVVERTAFIGNRQACREYTSQTRHYFISAKVRKLQDIQEEL